MSGYEPMCEQCPFRPEAPRAVWDLDEYKDLVFSYRKSQFFCHRGRRGPADERTLCGGWQRAHAYDPDVLGDAGAVYLANIPAFEAIDRGEKCVGSGESVRGAAIKARCPVCGIVLPTEGEIPSHLPPGHPAGGVPAVAP